MLSQQVLRAFNYGVALSEMLRFFYNRSRIWWEVFHDASTTAVDMGLKKNSAECKELAQHYDHLCCGLTWTLKMRSECFEVASASHDRKQVVLGFVFPAWWGDGRGGGRGTEAPDNFRESMEAAEKELRGCGRSRGPDSLPGWVPESLLEEDFECFSGDEECKKEGNYCYIFPGHISHILCIACGHITYTFFSGTDCAIFCVFVSCCWVWVEQVLLFIAEYCNGVWGF
jgi:hypothetical protein